MPPNEICLGFLINRIKGKGHSKLYMLHKFKVAKYLMYLTPTYLSERGPFDIRSTLRRFYGLSRNTTRPFHVFFFQSEFGKLWNFSCENFGIKWSSKPLQCHFKIRKEPWPRFVRYSAPPGNLASIFSMTDLHTHNHCFVEILIFTQFQVNSTNAVVIFNSEITNVMVFYRLKGAISKQQYPRSIWLKLH